MECLPPYKDLFVEKYQKNIINERKKKMFMI